MKLKFWEKPTRSEKVIKSSKKVLDWITGKPEPKRWWEIKK